MSNSISRRTFLKCTGASVAALGAASLLGGCQQNGSATIVDVKVGDKVSNWNGLGVQLTSLFNIDTAPAQAGYEYIAVLVTVVNRTKNQTFNIGAQNLAEINAAYPVPPQENVDANFHALAAASTDFSASCDGQSVELSLIHILMEWSIRFMAEMRSMVRSMSKPVNIGPAKCCHCSGVISSP